MKARRFRNNIYWLKKKKILFCYKNIKIKLQFLQNSCRFRTFKKPTKPAKPASRVQIFWGYKVSDPYPYPCQPVAWPLQVMKPLPIPSCESQVHFFFLSFCYTCTNNYLLLHRLWTTTNESSQLVGGFLPPSALDSDQNNPLLIPSPPLAHCLVMATTTLSEPMPW